VESKGVMFTAEAKYGLDLALLKKEIDEKLVTKKGVNQLVRNIQQAFRKDKPRSIDGLNLSACKKVFPVLVTLDDLGAALVMNRYLADRFAEANLAAVLKVECSPLFSLSSQDVENICGYLPDA